MHLLSADNNHLRVAGLLTAIIRKFQRKEEIFSSDKIESHDEVRTPKTEKEAQILASSAH
jgi:hypothetical protein